jgi:YfiH family protein
MIRVTDGGLVYYQFAGLRGEPGLRHACFTRLGGVSRPPYATLNVGASVGDDPEAVATNRERCLAALGFDPSQAVSPYQVHGTVVARVSHEQRGQLLPATDGLVTAERGVGLLLRFADCAPIMLYDRRRSVVGLVHAGWKGTLEGIAAVAARAMQAHFGSRPADLWAGIGPAIGRCCYEVGADLAEHFRRKFGPRVLAGSCPPRLDLAAASGVALEELGVCEIEQADLCTACHHDEFYSHRREGGRIGRLAVIVGLAAEM